MESYAIKISMDLTQFTTNEQPEYYGVIRRNVTVPQYSFIEAVAPKTCRKFINGLQHDYHNWK